MGHVTNFCDRSGSKYKIGRSSTIDDALLCSKSIAVAFKNDLVTLYDDKADLAKSVALQQKVSVTKK